MRTLNVPPLKILSCISIIFDTNLFSFQPSSYHGRSPKKHAKYVVNVASMIVMDKEERKSNERNDGHKTNPFQSVDYSAFWIFLFIFFLFNSIYWCIYGY